MQPQALLHLRTGKQEQVHRAQGLAEAPAQAIQHLKPVVMA